MQGHKSIFQYEKDISIYIQRERYINICTELRNQDILTQYNFSAAFIQFPILAILIVFDVEHLCISNSIDLLVIWTLQFRIKIGFKGHRTCNIYWKNYVPWGRVFSELLFIIVTCHWLNSIDTITFLLFHVFRMCPLV